MPTATHVAGFWTWKNLGRGVKAGQVGGVPEGEAARDEKQYEANGEPGEQDGEGQAELVPEQVPGQAGSAPPVACAGKPPAVTPVLALTPSTVK